MTQIGKYLVTILSLLYTFQGVEDQLIEFQSKNFTVKRFILKMEPLLITLILNRDHGPNMTKEMGK